MIAQRFFLQLPPLSLKLSAALAAVLVAAAGAAFWATPHLVEVANAPSLEDTVPRQFGDWKELPSPYAQVSLSTGLDPSMDQPYDQTVMRTYVNSKGEQVMLALAWGKRQRQEVKIHRPDLCYIAQGYEITGLQAANFSKGQKLAGEVTGKHMTAMSSRGGEAVAYWVRIGNLYSEGAFETRLHIFKQGLGGQVPDGILVRASQRIRSVPEAETVFPHLDQFLNDLYRASPSTVQALMIRT